MARKRLSEIQASMLAATFRCVRFLETHGQPAVFGVGPQKRTISTPV